MTADGRCWLTATNSVVVYQIDYNNGELVKAFAFGDPTVRDDFEGIAAQGNVVYLVTSHGKIYRAPEGRNGERVEYETFDTGLWEQCEIEGLALDLRGQDLLLACKEPHNAAKSGVRMIYRWSTREHRVLESQSIAIDASAVARRLDTKSFNPSDVTVDPNGHLLLLHLTSRRSLKPMRPERWSPLCLPLADRHRQPEGLAIAPDGRLIIADGGRRGGVLASMYRDDRTRPRHDRVDTRSRLQAGKDVLYDLWVSAISCGLRRDHPTLLPAFDAATNSLPTYGDATAALLHAAGGYTTNLSTLRTAAMHSTRWPYSNRKNSNGLQYERLPGKTPFREFLVDVGAPLVSSMGLPNGSLRASFQS